jgi:hypothetical protein
VLTDYPTTAPAARPKRRRPKLPPLLVDAPAAAALCGVSVWTWRALTAAEKTPAPVRLNGRVLWNHRELARWCDAGCPARSEWQAIRQQERRRHHRH